MSIGLTDKEFAWMQRIEREIDAAWDDLTSWEQTFIEELIERFHQYGVVMMISPKQWEIIGRISEKIL